MTLAQAIQIARTPSLFPRAQLIRADRRICDAKRGITKADRADTHAKLQRALERLALAR